jgi:hypothetical protein
MTPGTGWQPSDEFLDRVKRAYRLSVEGWQGVGHSFWGGIYERQKPVHDALLDPGNDKLRAIFKRPGATDLFYGVDNLFADYIALVSNIGNPAAKQGATQECETLIADLADATGMSAPGEFSELDATLHQRIEFNNPFPDEFGAVTPRGVASYRALQAIYQTSRIISLLPRGGSVVEIGPGAGRTALFSFRTGMIEYTTIDLPMGMVAQACFLGATAGPDALWLPGDSEDLRSGRIAILAGSQTLPDRRFDLAVNVDSLTEMSIASAFRYARWMPGHADRFLSINHSQNQFTASEICRRSFNATGVTRQPYPLRAGYTEEVFVVGTVVPAWVGNLGMTIADFRRRFIARFRREISSARARFS